MNHGKEKKFLYKTHKIYGVFFHCLIFFVSFSLFFSIRVIHSTPILHQETHFNFGSGHDPVGDFSTNSSNEVKDAILIGTQLRESVNTSGLSNFSRKDQETHFDSGSGHDPVGDFSTNSPNAVKDAILIDTQLKESVNTSGFSKFSRKDCDLNDTQDSLIHLNGSVHSVGELISSVLIAPKQKVNKSLDFDGVVINVNALIDHENGSESLFGKVEVSKNSEIQESTSKKSCDVSKGKLVFDDSYPLYTNATCPFIDEGFSCQTNGRL
ncbi:hypothetical protein POM88_047578 [Heracleum sosnowskyi]|uniref:Trichome birefringence-like N-terminal domain-containing protein n=1 Tax=Heracleum sosnowskyi TaxID=360622 RepID=A0AAD8GSG2_9APIA|nr:hypothetical protein POM88_047578 [Heracleum sosnowskyi]